jgi:hypothetical protein
MVLNEVEISSSNRQQHGRLAANRIVKKTLRRGAVEPREKVNLD